MHLGRGGLKQALAQLTSNLVTPSQMHSWPIHCRKCDNIQQGGDIQISQKVSIKEFGIDKSTGFSNDEARSRFSGWHWNFSSSHVLHVSQSFQSSLGRCHWLHPQWQFSTTLVTGPEMIQQAAAKIQLVTFSSHPLYPLRSGWSTVPIGWHQTLFPWWISYTRWLSWWENYPQRSFSHILLLSLSHAKNSFTPFYMQLLLLRFSRIGCHILLVSHIVVYPDSGKMCSCSWCVSWKCTGQARVADAHINDISEHQPCTILLPVPPVRP